MDTSISSMSTQQSTFIQQLPDSVFRLLMSYTKPSLPEKLRRLQKGLAEMKMMFEDMSIEEFSALVANQALILNAAQERSPSQGINYSPSIMQGVNVNSTPPRREASNMADLQEGNMMYIWQKGRSASVCGEAIAACRRRSEATEELLQDIKRVQDMREDHGRHLRTARLCFENSERKFLEEAQREDERLFGRVTTHFDVIKQTFSPSSRFNSRQRVVRQISGFNQTSGARFDY